MLILAAKKLSTLQKTNLYLQEETLDYKKWMIKIRERFQQIISPQAHVEFSVDAYNLFLSRSAHACAQPWTLAFKYRWILQVLWLVKL